MEQKFTKEIKENWLKELKSGKHTQCFEDYVDKENRHCCIAVLGRHVLEDDRPFEVLKPTIGDNALNQLIMTNDDSDFQKSGKRDYSNVLSLIEALPTQD